MTRAAWPHLIAQKYGRIINTAFPAGYLGVEGKYEYDTVKAAIHGLTQTLAFEANRHNIHVNVVCPAANTRPLKLMAETSPPGLLPESYFGPAYSTELVEPMVTWLAHEECQANGETFLAASGSRLLPATRALPAGLESHSLDIAVNRRSDDRVRSAPTRRVTVVPEQSDRFRKHASPASAPWLTSPSVPLRSLRAMHCIEDLG